MDFQYRRKRLNPLRLLFLSILLTLIVSSLFVGKTNAILIFQSGFETGDFSEWTDNYGGGTVQTTSPHHGTYSYKTNCGNLDWVSTWKLFDSRDPIYAQAMFKVTQMHTGTEDPYTFFLFSVPSMYWYTEGFGVSLDLDSATYGDSDWRIRFFYYNTTTGFHYTLVGVLLTNIWYKWQIAGHRSTGPADGWFKMWQNNALVVEINNVVTSPQAYDGVEVGHIAFWGGTMGTNATMYFDCVQVWDNFITDGFAPSLNVLSEPPTSVSFEVNDVSQTTPYNTQTTGSYFLSAEPIILANQTVYYFQYWTVAGIDYYESAISYYFTGSINVTATMHYITSKPKLYPPEPEPKPPQKPLPHDYRAPIIVLALLFVTWLVCRLIAREWLASIPFLAVIVLASLRIISLCYYADFIIVGLSICFIYFLVQYVRQKRS